MKREKLFLTGYAKLPEGITAWELYKVIGVGMTVDKETGKILETECTFATEMAKNFINDLVVGKNINCVHEIEEELEKYYYGSAKKPIISAIRSCSNKYKQIKTK
ncbi:MAG: DUF3870 domain-containing protein [Firmicutes bacterium]|nr:DUF3870 domain-containing protein [Bacillota bacterium]